MLGSQTALGHFLPVINIGHCLSPILISQAGDTFLPFHEEQKLPLCGCGFGVAKTYPAP